MCICNCNGPQKKCPGYFASSCYFDLYYVLGFTTFVCMIFRYEILRNLDHNVVRVFDITLCFCLKYSNTSV